ncbi:MAG: S41 family peptidase [Patescibacteria group bacterium]|nr:S41 family peptidase [Patescibacteria group bacterium]
MNNKTGKRKYLITLVVFFILAAFIGGFLLGFSSNSSWQKNVSLKEALSLLSDNNSSVNYILFNKVWHAIEENYVNGSLDKQKMLYGAISGLVNSLEDPYSTFLNPELSKVFLNEIEGSFEGIGAEIGIKNNQLQVIAPLEGSPAKKAGLQAKDKIIKIDGQETTNMSLDYAVSLIRGEKDTAVTLTVAREGLEELKDIKITRDKINIKSVDWSIITSQDKKIGYLEISSFTDDTMNLLDQATNDFLLKDVQGIILDLRNNSGGYLETSIKVASLFIEEGVIVKEKFSEENITEYQAKGEAKLQGYPMTVIINEGSASASEIVAGALKDYNQATLVGETSFGKGSVQEYEQFSDGSSLKLTTAKWLTPKGHNINEKGITPDVEVELTQEDFDNDKDPQFDKALELIKEEINQR